MNGAGVTFLENEAHQLTTKQRKKPKQVCACCLDTMQGVRATREKAQSGHGKSELDQV